MHLPDEYGLKMDENRRATRGALRGARDALSGTAKGRLTSSGAADRQNSCNATTSGRVIKCATRRLPQREVGSLSASTVPTSVSHFRQVPSGVARPKSKNAATVSTSSYVVHSGKSTSSARSTFVRDTGICGSGGATPPKKASLSRALFSAMLDVFGPKPGVQQGAPEVTFTSGKNSPLDTAPLPQKLAKLAESSAVPCSTVSAVGQPGQSPWGASGTSASDSEPFIEDVEMEDLSDAIDNGFNTQGPLSDYEGTYVITDTNIFVSHLNLVKTIMAPRGGADEMVVYIPWMAIQELDHMKTKKADTVQRSAIAAVAYIYKALASKHPRLRGQTIAEARRKDEILPKDGLCVNDDHFLHCCLELREQGNRVLLLTDDRNLRNKAMINGIETLSAREMEVKLTGRRSGRPPTPLPAPLADRLLTAAKPPVQTFLDEKAARAEACDILKKSLSLVLESELENAFGDVWTRVVTIPPPWDERTALECILKHWIALGGTAFKPSLKPIMVQLLDLLKSGGGELSRLLYLVFTLCSDLQLHYSQLAEDVARLEELHGTFPAKQSRPRTLASDIMVIASQSQTSNRVRHPAGRHQEEEATLDAVVFVPNPAVELLADVWPLINDYCGNINQLMSKQHPFTYIERPSITLDWFTMREVYKRMTMAMGFMGSLINRTNQQRANLLDMADAFVNTLVELAKLLLHKAGLPDVDWNATADDIVDHVLDPMNKTINEVGYSQIVALHNILGNCILHMLEPETPEAASE